MERDDEGQAACAADQDVCRFTPIGALLRGLAAGALGVAWLDLFQLWGYRRGGGDRVALDWEFSRGLTWADAPAPAQVGRRAVEGIFKVTVPDERAPLMNNVVHWAYGISWGGAFGLVEASVAHPRLRHGLVFRTAVWLVGYAILPLAKLYRPLWTYDLPSLGRDWGGHLAYGLGSAAAWRILRR